MSQAIGKTGLAFARAWHHVDARNRVLGRLAASIAVTLMGKHKPTYDPAVDAGDYVVVTNARQITVTGKKAQQKLYRHHTGYPGGLREIPYARLMERRPDEIIRRAVSGMLPKNTLRDRRLNRLHIFPDDEHPYGQNILARYDAGELVNENGPATLGQVGVREVEAARTREDKNAAQKAEKAREMSNP